MGISRHIEAATRDTFGRGPIRYACDEVELNQKDTDLQLPGQGEGLRQIVSHE